MSESISCTTHNATICDDPSEIWVWLKEWNTDQVIILTDENTQKFCLPEVWRDHNVQHIHSIVIPAGELYKTLDTCGHIWDELHRLRASRNSLLVSLGGGVVTDIGGFCASVYKRGIRHLCIPTTVLAQADAAIGGKTGIDHRFLKNVIGTFYPPVDVWICPVFLQTLPQRQIINGLAEIIKHGIIADRKLFEKMEGVDAFNVNTIAPYIASAASIKCTIIDRDPKEQGVRKILNYGHTAGHAIESMMLSRGEDLLHGEAIALGIKIEARIAHLLGKLDNQELSRIETIIDRHFPILQIAREDITGLIDLMHHDKKNSNLKISFSLPEGIGDCTFDVFPSVEHISNAIEYYTV
jgi:3-dehydroquinate synthase